MLYVIIILIILVLFLFVRLLLIKKELKRVTKDMKNNPENNMMNMDFIDRDLQKMITEVNVLYERIMNIKAEGKDEERKIRESISMISHDMRTPLTSVIGYLQVAERTDDIDEKNANIKIALERARYLNDLVNDFFDISLIESGKVDLNIEKVNLPETICEEILAESCEIDKKGIVPVFEQSDMNIYVRADKKKLARIMQNLISNAVKYSEGRLEFRIDDNESGKITMRMITDYSKDIDTDRIFERFYRDDPSRSKGGAGLGLYICKQLVEMMEGSIAAEQKGKEFVITISFPAV
ncbi:MAG: HAMP domain-containing histidine kinase [Clostridiales bacterium]|nr:HAMP domain-containing histidine kinase [Clostridiales bacterium]